MRQLAMIGTWTSLFFLMSHLADIFFFSKEPSVPNSYERKQQQQDYDVVVIGGGIEGIIASFAAAQEGVKVLLVDDNLRPSEPEAENSQKEKQITLKELYSYADVSGTLTERDLYLRDAKEERTVYQRINQHPQLNVMVDATVTGVVVKGNDLIGIKLKKGKNEEIIRAKRFIDATYENNVAVKAGVPLAQAGTKETDVQAIYRVTEEKASNEEKHWDTIASSSVKTEKNGEVGVFSYEIPLRALIPETIDGLLVLSANKSLYPHQDSTVQVTERVDMARASGITSAESVKNHLGMRELVAVSEELVISIQEKIKNEQE